MPRYSVVETPLSSVDARLHARWTGLEARALQGNAYLSPHFVLPAARFLPNLQDAIVFQVVEDSEEQRLVGLGVFTLAKPTRTVLVRHLVAFHSIYTLVTSILVDRTHAKDAVGAMLDHFARAGRSRWGAVLLSNVDTTGPFGVLLNEELARRGVSVIERDAFERAVVDLRQDTPPIERLSTSVRKELRRARKKLTALGRVTAAVRFDRTFDAASIETFLELEHQGWKKERGTSLLSTAAHAEFFRRMIRGFAEEGRAVYAELALDGRVVAASINLLSGPDGFAFKIGWDPGLAKCSIGKLTETALLEGTSELATRVARLDSGSEPGSYMERLWPDRTRMASVCFPTSTAGRRMLHLARFLGALRRQQRRTWDRLRAAIEDRRRSWRDAQLDRRYGLDTAGIDDDLAGLGIAARHHAQSRGHEPIQLDVFERVVKALRVVPGERCFVDLGSGKGRAVILAMEAGFASAVGVEISPKLHAIAQANVAKYQKRRGRDQAIELTCGDAGAYAPPPKDTVLFLYNPFGAPVLRTVLDNMRASMRHSPRALTIVYRNPVHADILRGCVDLDCVFADRGFEIYEWRSEPKDAHG